MKRTQPFTNTFARSIVRKKNDNATTDLLIYSCNLQVAPFSTITDSRNKYTTFRWERSNCFRYYFTDRPLE